MGQKEEDMTWNYKIFDGKNIQTVTITCDENNELSWDNGGAIFGEGAGETDPEKLICYLANTYHWQRPHLAGIGCEVAVNQASRIRQDTRSAPCPICAEWVTKRKELKEAMLG